MVCVCVCVCVCACVHACVCAVQFQTNALQVNTKQVLCADLIADGWQSERTSEYQSVNCWEECLHVRNLYYSLSYLCTCPSPPPHILTSPYPSPTSAPPHLCPSLCPFPCPGQVAHNQQCMVVFLVSTR